MNDGTVAIHGKQYKTVALRVNEFRAAHPVWTIRTSLIEADERIVVMKAEILDDTGRLISSGYAEENRTSSQINRTSALENCETSAIGRALAFFGLAGSEIASADEVATAINHQNKRESVSRAPKNEPPSVTVHEWVSTWTEEAGKIEDDGHRAKMIKEVTEAARTKDKARATAAEKDIKAALSAPIY